MKIEQITGTITTTDGTTSLFRVTSESFQQWGADTKRLGVSVDALEAIGKALLSEYLIVTPEDPRCDVCGMLCEDVDEWCGECGVCLEHCFVPEHQDGPEDTPVPPVIPLPGEPFDGGTVLASVWLRDEEPPLVVVLLLLMPLSPYYCVVDAEWRGNHWEPTMRSDFLNLVPAAEHYRQNGGDY